MYLPKCQRSLLYIEILGQQCRKEITVNLFPDPDNVQHPRVAQLRDDEVVVIELGGLVVVWLQATDIPVEKTKSGAVSLVMLHSY